MGAHDFDAFMHRFLADDGQNDRFALLVPVHLVSRLQGFHVVYRLESLFLCLTDDFSGSQPFGAGGVKEGLVLLAVIHDSLALFLIHALPYGLCSAVCFFHYEPPIENDYHIYYYTTKGIGGLGKH